MCISVIVPVLNEGRFIERTLRSLEEQRTPGFVLEVLVVDGMSQDDTRERVAAIAAEDHRIKLLSNPLGHTSAALNIGLRAATGEYVGILGAHASYNPDYISVCLQELLARDAVGCSGKLMTTPADSSLQASLVAWAMSHPFASSSRSVRTQPEGYSDTVPFPVMRKQALLEAGGYNELLIRNQDNDMNQRLRSMGHKLYVTGKTQCRYFPRSSVKSFLKYAFMSGEWNARSLKRNPNSLGLRHLAPLIFVTSLIILLAAALGGLAVPSARAGGAALALGIVLSAHLSAGTVAGIEVCLREKTIAALWLGPLILAFHCCYGLGTLRELLFPSPMAATVSQAQSMAGSSKGPV